MALVSLFQIYDIFQLLAPKIQVGVFLATMPPEALEITRKLMNRPVRILVKLGEFTPEREEMKLETLSSLSEKQLYAGWISVAVFRSLRILLQRGNCKQENSGLMGAVYGATKGL